MTFVDTIIQHQLPTDQYVNIVCPKKQIYIHHTASDSNPYGVIEYWKSNSEKVGTAFIIAGKPHSSDAKYKDGDIIQCFPSNKGGWHLGLKPADLARGGPKHKTNTELNLQSVGIETTAWGGLTKSSKGWVSYDGIVIPDSEVVEYPDGYRGYHAYHKYSIAQLDSLRNLLIYLCDRYDIPKTYRGDEIFDIYPPALCGERMIASHVSVRPASEKQDMHPQVELIQMLKSL